MRFSMFIRSLYRRQYDPKRFQDMCPTFAINIEQQPFIQSRYFDPSYDVFFYLRTIINNFSLKNKKNKQKQNYYLI